MLRILDKDTQKLLQTNTSEMEGNNNNNEIV